MLNIFTGRIRITTYENKRFYSDLLRRIADPLRSDDITLINENEYIKTLIKLHRETNESDVLALSPCLKFANNHVVVIIKNKVKDRRKKY